MTETEACRAAYRDLPPDTKELLATFSQETLAKAELRGRNTALAAIKNIIRLTKMNETTKTYLLNQIDALRQ